MTLWRTYEGRTRSAVHAGISGRGSEAGNRGRAVGGIDAKTSGVVIRRSGRVVDRLVGDKAVTEFADAKNLSGADRETLVRLSALKNLEPEARAAARQAMNAQSAAREAELANGIAADTAKRRIRAEVERNDAEIFARVEALN